MRVDGKKRAADSASAFFVLNNFGFMFVNLFVNIVGFLALILLVDGFFVLATGTHIWDVPASEGHFHFRCLFQEIARKSDKARTCSKVIRVWECMLLCVVACGARVG